MTCRSHLLILCWAEHCLEQRAGLTSRLRIHSTHLNSPFFPDVWRQFVQSLLFRAENQVFHLTTISSQGSQCKLSATEPLPVGEIHWLCERCPAHTTCATACHGARPWRACLLPRSISQHFAWIWHIVQTWAVVPNSKINNHVLGSQQLPNVSDALT